MAFIIKDRVKEGTTSTGTGAITLSGSLATFDTFQSYMTNGDTTYYAIVHTSSGVDEWEVGLGTWNTGNTLTRTTVLAGSNGTSAENFSAGSKDVFMTYPAAHAALAGDDVNFANITVTGTVDGRDVATDGSKLDTVEQNADVTDAINVAAAGALMKSGGTMTGNLILNGDPTVALGAATKEYVDTIAAAGIHYHTPVRVEAPLNLTVTYNNGASGVGATLTNAGTQEAITIDGVALSSGDRVLVYEQTDATQNGIYTVTTVGSGSTNWVLTRATDADSYGASDPNALGEGDAYFVKEGATGAGELYVMNTAGTITFGTTDITFTVIAETAVYSAGTGLTLTGTTFAIGQDVGTTANVTFNQVTAAIIGNVTGNVTGDVTGNAGTATKLATARNIALSGDVTGNANFDGTGNISITAVVQDDSHSHVISNVDGLQTALNGKTPTSRTITAGDGLTGGGDLTANRTLNVGAGTGVTVNADTVSIGQDVGTTANVTFNDIRADGGNLILGDDAYSTSTDYVGMKTSYQSGSNDYMIISGTADGATYVSAKSGLPVYIRGGGNQTAYEIVVSTNAYATSAGSTIITEAGSGLSKSSRTLSHADTSTQASVNNSDGTVIQDITLDTYGHITGIASTNLDGRYYTETEADSRFVNVTGDTMTGTLTLSSSGYADQLTVNRSDGDYYSVIKYANSTGELARMGFTNTGVLHYRVGASGTLVNIFHDNYHPNADKWTTARTLSLSGQASGSVSWDGSANATLSVTLNDSSLDDQYVTVGSRYSGDGDSLIVPSKASIRIWDVSTASDAPSGSSDGLVLSAGWDSGSWGIQQYHDFHTNDLYLRAKTNNVMTSWDKVFHDTYHPNADKWTTARTLSLSGDASGSVSWDGSANATLSVAVADNSHNHQWINDDTPSNAPSDALQYLNTQGNTTDSPTTDWYNTIRMGHGNPNSYYNNTLAMAMTGSNVGALYGRTRTAGTAGSWNRFFADNYHPNADKWTTARTLSLSGDASGSVSWDGSANATLSVTVANDSHSHSNYITSNADDTATGKIVFGSPISAGSSAKIQVGGFQRTGPIMLAQGNTNATSFNTTNERWLMNDGTNVYASTISNGYNNKIWTDANDGPGSGLNADLLDGKDHTNFGATLATYGSTASSSGRIRCTAPFNTNSAHMFQITISVYSSYNQHTYVVGGYMYPSTNNWYSPTCVYSGTGNPDIVVGRDSNGKAYISIANGNYTGVRVHNMTLGYQTNVADTYDPWTITIDGATENSVTPTVHKTWNSVNDGSGSGLDADTVDGIEASSFLRSDANDTASGSYSFTNSYNEFGNSTGSVSNDGSWNARLNLAGSSHARLDVKSVSDGIITTMYSHTGQSAGKVGTFSNHPLKLITNGTDNATLSTAGSLSTTAQGTLWGSSNDGSGSSLDADLLDGVQGSSYLRSDATDTFTNLSGTSLTLGSGVTLQESTDRADLLQITSSTGGWAGLQIRNSSNEGRWSFMTDGSSAGFYDDENGDWAVQMQENGGVTLYHNSVANFTTGATYMEMARHLDLNNYDIYGVDQIFHHGDTDTYMQFHEVDQWRVVTGGSERLEVNNSQITSTEPIYAPSFHGDGSGLTNLPSGSAAFNDLTSKTSGTGDYRTTGRFLGEGALALLTTGVQNTAYGYQAGYYVNSGNNNAFFGHTAGRRNSQGKENVAVGSLALSQQTSYAYGNTALGYKSMMNYGTTSTTLYSRNTAVGWNSLSKASINSVVYTTAVGAEAMQFYIGGDNSTAVGKGALRGVEAGSVSTGDRNTAVGSHSMYLIQNGFENVGVGAFTLSNCAGGDQNVAIGYSAIQDLTTGNLNAALGYKALENVTSGVKNVGIGPNALKNVTTGSSNIGIGGWGASSSVYNPAYNITTQSNYGYFGSAQLTNLYTKVAWTITSDPRDKEILGPVPIGMDFLRKIEPIAYKMKANREDTKGVDRTRYGFNAAEVLEAEGDDPVIIDKSDENQLRLTDGMIATVVVALKELDKKLNLLDEKLALLESKQ